MTIAAGCCRHRRHRCRHHHSCRPRWNGGEGIREVNAIKGGGISQRRTTTDRFGVAIVIAAIDCPEDERAAEERIVMPPWLLQSLSMDGGERTIMKTMNGTQQSTI
jgi:hypothetical protein